MHFSFYITLNFLKLNGELITLQINANGNNVYESGDQCGNSTFTYNSINAISYFETIKMTLYKIGNPLILFQNKIEISPLNQKSKNVIIDDSSINNNNNNNNTKTFITMSPPPGNVVESYKSYTIFKINGINFNNLTFTIVTFDNFIA
ncbi:hypothetical protein DDB_G0286775 [Dictyostelium discoideum AX4]|uniref:Uncharacterized protein n=1 Tax=Dictyostelium discoideum TaxID=44689 RepID=Q54LL3_DICDI|nr:hypothetical protein DDB_G0286775 [Dictyostelium discoideum AX4]EAL64143.1 hypothetical protein DDB_G0286775 [Dictyostelium discoideum AX4]|eukprot:XP_637548.1 hypothetical protein DDB_G0286775 [Dictyostelium discoideum AX4]